MSVNSPEQIYTPVTNPEQIHTPVTPRPGTLIDHVKWSPYLQYEAQMRQAGWIRVSKRGGWSEAVAYRWRYDPDHARRVNNRYDAVTWLLGLVFALGLLSLVLQLST
jgi:hypothetical protein